MSDRGNGRGGRDPLSLPAPAVPFSKAISDGSYGLPRRLAWAPDLGGLAPVRPDLVRVCEHAIAWFGNAGVTVDRACPDVSDAPFIFQVSPSGPAMQYY